MPARHRDHATAAFPRECGTDASPQLLPSALPGKDTRRAQTMGPVGQCPDHTVDPGGGGLVIRRIDPACEEVPCREMRRLYQDEVICRGRLLSLLCESAEARAGLQLTGYLHEDCDVEKTLSPANLYQLLLGPSGLLGFYYAIRDRGIVERLCAHDLGWSRDMRYRTPADLPHRSALGQVIWLRPGIVLEVFRSLDRLVLAGDLAVKEFAGEVRLRGQGLGKALKLAAYRVLSEDHLVLGRIFEIERVNGRLVAPAVVNRPSTAVAEHHGGMKIGWLREAFTREDGLRLQVAWGLWLFRVGDVLSRDRVANPGGKVQR